MAIHESGEMYLETIYVLSKERPAVRAIDVGEHMGFSKPSVSRAIGLLKSGGYVNVDDSGALTLTEAGLEVAHKIYERHTIITQFLVNLGVTPETAAERCADIWDVFNGAGIPVIRMGLNPTEELSGGAAVAGAYHPAMGQLVRSARLYKMATKELDRLMPFEGAEIRVQKGRLSDMRGQKNANISKLSARYPNAKIVIKESPEQKEEIFITKT